MPFFVGCRLCRREPLNPGDRDRRRFDELRDRAVNAGAVCTRASYAGIQLLERVALLELYYSSNKRCHRVIVHALTSRVLLSPGGVRASCARTLGYLRWSEDSALGALDLY